MAVGVGLGEVCCTATLLSASWATLGRLLALSWLRGSDIYVGKLLLGEKGCVGKW